MMRFIHLFGATLVLQITFLKKQPNRVNVSLAQGVA
jgi:hypothetical protein